MKLPAYLTAPPLIALCLAGCIAVWASFCWLTGQQHLLQSYPGSPIINLDSAIVLLLTACSIYSFTLNLKPITRAFSGLILVYLVLESTGLGAVLTRLSQPDPLLASIPPLVAPAVVLALVLLNVALLLYTFIPTPHWRQRSLALPITLTLTIASYGGLGAASGFPVVGPWSKSVLSMPFLTALTLALLCVPPLMQVWRDEGTQPTGARFLRYSILGYLALHFTFIAAGAALALQLEPFHIPGHQPVLLERCFVAAALLGGAMLTFLMLTVRHESAVRLRREMALQQSSHELEAIVRQRTADLESEVSMRKIIASNLMAIERHLDLCLEFSSTAAWVWHPDTDSTTWRGPVAKVFGIDRKHMASYALLRQVMHPEDRDRVDQVLDECFRTQSPFLMRFRIFNDRGELRWIEGRGSIAFDSEGVRAMHGINYDITAQKTSELALQSSERRFRALANAMPQLVWTANSKGHFDYCNDRWYELTGMPRDTPMTLESRKAITHPEDYEIWLMLWKRSLEMGIPYTMEYRLWHAGSQEFRWHLARAVSVWSHEDNDLRWFGISTDIHDRKLAEERLQVSERTLRDREAQLNAIFQYGAVGDYSWDIVNDTVACAASIWQIYGDRPPEYPTPSAWFGERQHPDDRAYINSEVQRALESSSQLQLEFRVCQPDGSIRWIELRAVIVRDGKGVPVRVNGINLDITQRKHIEIALQQSEEQLRVLADAMPQVVWMADPEGRLEYLNNRWFELTGLGRDPQSRNQYVSVLHPDDVGPCQESWKKSITTHQPFELELRLRDHRSGEYIWHLSRAVPCMDANGKLSRWIGTSTNIHEQKAAKDLLERQVADRSDALLRSIHQEEISLPEP